jgi:hypothetical protein
VRRGHLGGWVWGFLLLTLFTARGEFQIERATDRVTIHQEAGPMVTFVYRDPQVPRPYFMHWHAPDGFLLTRRFPPVEGLDATDHETMHPGIWLSFSGISGSDFWRNKAPTTFGGFTEEPFVRDGVAGWSFRNHYATTSGPTVTEECTIRFADRPLGTLLFWDSAFTSTGEVVWVFVLPRSCPLRMVGRCVTRSPTRTKKASGAKRRAGSTTLATCAELGMASFWCRIERTIGHPTFMLATTEW